MAVELWYFYWLQILRIPFLCHRQRFDFLLQHCHDDALDYYYIRFHLWMACRVFPLLGTIWLDEAWRLGTFEGKNINFRKMNSNWNNFILDGNNAVFECLSDAITRWIKTDNTPQHRLHDASIINSLILVTIHFNVAQVIGFCKILIESLERKNWQNFYISVQQFYKIKALDL